VYIDDVIILNLLDCIPLFCGSTTKLAGFSDAQLSFFLRVMEYLIASHT